jgi:hypothetical protein
VKCGGELETQKMEKKEDENNKGKKRIIQISR